MTDKLIEKTKRALEAYESDWALSADLDEIAPDIARAFIAQAKTLRALLAERDRYKARAERAEGALKQNGALQNLLDLDADQCLLTFDPQMGWPDGLSKPLNNPDTGDRLQVAHLDVEDSGYGPRLWDYAISVLRSARDTLAQIDADPADEPAMTLEDAYREGLEAAATRVNELSHAATANGDFKQASILANEAEAIRALSVSPELGGE